MCRSNRQLHPSFSCQFRSSAALKLFHFLQAGPLSRFAVARQRCRFCSSRNNLSRRPLPRDGATVASRNPVTPDKPRSPPAPHNCRSGRGIVRVRNAFASVSRRHTSTEGCYVPGRTHPGWILRGDVRGIPGRLLAQQPHPLLSVDFDLCDGEGLSSGLRSQLG